MALKAENREMNLGSTSFLPPPACMYVGTCIECVQISAYARCIYIHVHVYTYHVCMVHIHVSYNNLTALLFAI